MNDEFDPYYEWLGISPNLRPMNHYYLLGLDLRESDRTKISSAADQRVAYLRSFQQGKRAEQSQRLLNEVAAAASCLLNDEAKRVYDATLAPAPLTQIPRAQQIPGTQLPGPQQPLSMSALAGPMAPVGSHLVPEPAAPPRADSADLAAEPPPVAKPLAPAQPTAPPKANEDEKEGGELVEGSPRWVIVAFAVSAAALLASLALAAALWSGGRGSSPTEEETALQAASSPTTLNETIVEEPVAVMQEGDGSLRLAPSFAQLTEGLEVAQLGGAAVVGNWSRSEQAVAWRVRLVKPGVFQARLVYSTADDQPAGALRIQAGGKTQQVSLRGSGGPDQFVSETFYVAIAKFGVSTLTLEPAKIEGDTFISLQSFELVPQR